MTDVQKRLLEILKFFHSFCNEHDLRYYVIGGTMLGAVRHKGFIPWDDDVDVAMPRPDYEKLRVLMRDACQRYVLETCDSPDESFVFYYGKIYDTQTTLIEKARITCKRGLYLDVFPLDGAGDSLDEGEKFYRPIMRKMQFLATRTCALDKKRKLYKNAAIVISRLIPSFIVNEKKLAKEIDKLAGACDFDNSKYVGNLMSTYMLREIMPKEVFGKPAVYYFEGAEVYGPQLYEQYLTKLFGDWRKLPPEEKRVTNHPIIFMDLDKPYTNT